MSPKAKSDVLALRALGLVGTTNAGGAGKWRDEYAEQLRAAGAESVAILPDSDEPGRAHAEAVARSCHAAGLRVKIVALPDLPAKGDVSDYLAAGHAKQELVALIHAAPPFDTQAAPVKVAAADEDDTGQVRDLWPAPLARAAYLGVIGEIVDAIAPHTEADPAALVFQGLAMLGNIIGRTAHFRAEADTHYLNLFIAIVGTTAKGRKGVSLGHARRLFGPIDEDWTARCLTSGLSSGEGMIWAIRDPIEKQHAIKDKGKFTGQYESVIEDHGVSDKRLFIAESEFAGTLRVLMREGNTLSPLMRLAWDGHDLRSLTKNSPAKATAPLVSVVGHITRDEVRRYLDATESANGFGNRFLWVCATRARILPDGGGLVPLEALRPRLRRVVDYARGVGEMSRDAEARELWHRVYERLSTGRPGLLGSLTARAEAQVMRLACLYALGDLSPVVCVPHLTAALELWRYCFASCRAIFGDSLGDTHADTALAALRHAPAGLTRSDLTRDVFHGNVSGGDLSRALTLLRQSGLAACRREPGVGTGRPPERWFHEPETYERNEVIQPEGHSFVSFVGSPQRSHGEANLSARPPGAEKVSSTEDEWVDL